MSTECEDIAPKVPKNVPSISSLKIYVRLFKFLGIIRFENSTGTNIKSIMSVFHIFLISTTLVVLDVLLGAERISFLKTSRNVGFFELHLQYADVLIMIMIHISMLLSNIRHSVDSKSLLKDLSHFDRHLMEVFAITERKNRWRILIFYCFILRYPIVYALQILSTNKHLSLKIVLKAILVHIPQHIGMLYKITIICFFWELSFVFGRRYQLLKEVLEDIFIKQEIHSLRSELQKFKHLYRVLFMEVYKINQLFGPVLMCLVSKLISNYLTNFCWIISNKMDGEGKFRLAQFVTDVVSIQILFESFMLFINMYEQKKNYLSLKFKINVFFFYNYHNLLHFIRE